MADDTLQQGNALIRAKYRPGTGADTQIIGLDVGVGSGTETLLSGTNPMPVASRMYTLALTTGTITTAASAVTATTDVTSAGSVTVVIAGTYAGVNVSFEASVDGTTWVGILGQRSDSYATETTSGVLVANTTRAWDFPLPGFTQFRVRATAWTSGTANVSIAPAVNAFEIAPTVGLAPTTTPTQAGVAASVTSVTILAANSSRRGATVHNDSTSATLYLRLSASAAAVTSGNYTVMLVAGAYYEVPFNYNGQINGIWTAATGFCNVTELT